MVRNSGTYGECSRQLPSPIRERANSDMSGAICEIEAHSASDLFHQGHLLGLAEVPHLEGIEVYSTGDFICLLIFSIPDNLVLT